VIWQALRIPRRGNMRGVSGLALALVLLGCSVAEGKSKPQVGGKRPYPVISTQSRLQKAGVIQFVISWDRDVTMRAENAFVKDKAGHVLPWKSFKRLTQELERELGASLEASFAFEGDLAKVDVPSNQPMRKQNDGLARYVGEVVAADHTNLEVFLPEGQICGSFGCNLASNNLRVAVDTKPPPCVLVDITGAEYSSSTSVAVTVEFSSDVLHFDQRALSAYGYSLANRAMASTTLVKSHLSGGPRVFATTLLLDAMSDHAEVWLPMGSVLDFDGVVNCESNHFRTRLGYGGYASAVRVADVIPFSGEEFSVNTQDIADEAITHDKIAQDAVMNPNIEDGELLPTFNFCGIGTWVLMWTLYSVCSSFI
jgi:hypothetical protein